MASESGSVAPRLPVPPSQASLSSSVVIEPEIPRSTSIEIDNSFNFEEPVPVQPSSVFERIRERIRSWRAAVRSWDFNPPAHVSTIPRNIETVYVREPVREPQPETESLLSVEEKEEDYRPKEAKTREEEHQIILDALRQRFVCPNFAELPEDRPGYIESVSKGKPATKFGHTFLPATESEAERNVKRLSAAFREGKAPFDSSESLVVKLATLQKLQDALSCAVLEVPVPKSNSSRPEETNQYGDVVEVFHNMMDDVSEEVMSVHGIDPRDASETLPRNRSGDLPDLQALHQKLFRKRIFRATPKDLNAFIYPASGGKRTTDSTPRTPEIFRFPQNRDKIVEETMDISPRLSEPPKYPPPLPPKL